MARLMMAGLETSAHFLVTAEDTALICGFFSRSKTKVRSIAANFNTKKSGKMGYFPFDTTSQIGWKGVFSPVVMGRDRFTYCLCSNMDIGKSKLITTSLMEDDDWYEFLMTNYKLPLKKWWIPQLRDVLIQEELVKKPRTVIRTEDSEHVFITLNNENVCLNDLVCYDFMQLKEEDFERIVSECLRSKRIWITEAEMAPLQFSNLDEYFLKYGNKVVEDLDKRINPLVELRPNVRNLALKSKSLFPQQAATVEGILAMMRHKISYAVMNHGMGCGKTLQAASAIESAMVTKWLNQHPDKELKDAYEKEGLVCYRAIIMAPGHLVHKWAEEVTSEIPYAKATVIERFSQLIELREEGRKPSAKEFYIISKDFCKLDTQISPIPTQVKWKHVSVDICSECKEEHQKIVYKKGIGSNACCPDCHGKNFEPYSMPGLRLQKGLICPECGELLLKYKRLDPSSDDFSGESVVLTPASFAKHKNENSACYHCGAMLWGSNAAPVTYGNARIKEPKWYKVTHFTNHAKKGKNTAFVLKGFEYEYYKSCITTEGLTKASRPYGPRKVAPAHYIKKYLKGYFDFCVLDEVHKYLGESAQAVAAHTLSKASNFTLALTGTISNGTASSFYNLFWMLEPSRMKNMGFSYSSSELMRFCKEYGCVETVYEASSLEDRLKNSYSRGKMLVQPRVKPGISPVLFGKLLMDRCLFLDISDLSKYLPKLKEEVRLLDPPSELLGTYNHVIEILKDASQGETGMAALSSMLQFGLSYLDKPYGRGPIMDPYHKDARLCFVDNYDEFASLDVLTTKEQELIDLVNAEQAEGRNLFIYATFTAKEESNVTNRLKALVEKYCNLKGQVDIIHSTSPSASEREEYFHKRASEGIRVFITNPMNVETGLDFCFKYKGVKYNFPTLIFYQTSYMLAVIWQASRRAYRLNQTEECRNYYLGYIGTLQAAALEIMARKQVATAAIQGHFSAEGLSAMAQGVDARTQLAAALAKNDMGSKESLENMFDVLSDMNENVEEDEAFIGFKPSLTFYELIGKSVGDNVMEIVDTTTSAILPVASLDWSTMDAKTFFSSDITTFSLDDFNSFFAGFGSNFETTNTSAVVAETIDVETKTTKKKKAKKHILEGQMSLLDIA